MLKFYTLLIALLLLLAGLSLYPVYDALERGIIPGTDSWFHAIDLFNFYLGG